MDTVVEIAVTIGTIIVVILPLFFWNRKRIKKGEAGLMIEQIVMLGILAGMIPLSIFSTTNGPTIFTCAIMISFIFREMLTNSRRLQILKEWAEKLQKQETKLSQLTASAQKVIGEVKKAGDKVPTGVLYATQQLHQELQPIPKGYQE